MLWGCFKNCHKLLTLFETGKNKPVIRKERPCNAWKFTSSAWFFFKFTSAPDRAKICNLAKRNLSCFSSTNCKSSLIFMILTADFQFSSISFFSLSRKLVVSTTYKFRISLFSGFMASENILFDVVCVRHDVNQDIGRRCEGLHSQQHSEASLHCLSDV